MEEKKHQDLQRRALLNSILEKKKNKNISLNSIEILKRNEGKNYFLSSYEQKRLWFINKLNTESITYNIHFGFRIYGNLKVDVLQEAINAIAMEQESLRTKFKYINDELMQVVDPYFTEKIKNIDLSNVDSEIIEEEVKRVAKEESYKSFDLENGPLARFILIQIAPNERIFIVVIHHIIFDGWSMGVFYKSLSEKYNKLCNGKYSVNQEKRAQYADYAKWQRKELSRSKMEKQFEYWKNKLEDIDQSVEFPTDKKRPSMLTNNGDVVFFELEKDTVNNLKKYSTKCNCTVNTILLSVFKSLVYKYTKQNNITVGTAVANRKVDGIENIIGFFVNTIVLNTEINGDMKFSEVLKKVRDTSLEAYDNEEFPFNQLVERINPLRDSSRNPFFQLMYTYQNTPKSKVELQDLRVEEYALGSRRSAVDITLNIEENENRIFGVFEYNSNLFYKDTIQRICNQFKLIIEDILKDDNKRVDDISIINQEEKNLILNKFNDTYVYYDKERTVVDIFEEQVEKTPNNIAVVYENEKLTYKELNEKVNILGDKLRKFGIKSDDFIGISTERSLEMLIGILATVKAGAAYVPIDPKYPEDRINYIISDCRPKILLTYKSDTEIKGIPSMDLANYKIFEGNPKNLEKINSSDDLLCLIYTSGTTGKPKGVMIKHSNMVNYCLKSENSALNGVFKRNLKNMGSVTNMTFDIFGTESILVLANGMTTFIANSDEQEDVEYLSSFIERNSIEILQTTPSRIKILLSKPERLKNLNSLKYIILCGEKVESDIVNKLHEYTNAIVENAYGPSETTILSTANELLSEIIEDNVSIGKPISNTQVYILENSNLLGIGVPGELCIAGDGVAKGYLNRTELTEEKFINNPHGEGTLYRTGDLARWLPNGNIEYLGRIDEQVKIRGYRVELGEIASVLGKVKNILDVAVITKEDSSGEKAIYAYLVSDKNIDIKSVRKEIRKVLPEYMIPAYMMQIEEIPVNRNGKLDKRALPDILEENIKEYISPRNEMESIITRIFEEVVGRKNISVDSDFFEIGGHSLRATKVANRIEVETGIRIPIKIIFAERTAESIAKYLESYESKECAGIEKAETKEYYPMSSVQKRIYLIWQMEKESIAYNMPSYYKLKGRVRVEDIEKSLNELINRHEILRTSFVMKDGDLVQKILNKVEIDYSYEESINGITEIISEFTKPFDLNVGKLLRVKVVKREEEYYLLIDMHHIVSDGMSIGIFIKEFSAIYNGIELEELSLQYKDYSEWMRGRNLENQKAYWISQFEDKAPVIDLPYDYKRPAEQSYEGATTSIEFHQEVKNGIAELCTITGATEYMVLLAAFFVVLNKYTRQEDIVVGAPISGRTNKDMESMMGMFVNTLAIRERPATEKSFINFLYEIKESCLKAYEHQEYPFEELVEEVEVRRDFSRNPLFDVMFGLQNNEEVNLLMNDVKVEQIWGEVRISKFDLSLMIQSNKDGYFVGTEYCTALFKEETITKLLIHFKQTLYKVISNPKILIGEIEIITEEEKELISTNFNNTHREYEKEKTVVDLFEEQVKKTPNNIAVVFEDEEITYKELNKRANSLARILRKKGVGSDVVVGIMVERSVEMIVSIISILKAGGAYLPIDLSYPKERVEFILQNSRCKVLLTQKNILEDIVFEGNVICVEEESLYQESSRNLIKKSNTDDLVYIIYTSGTTGEPKGVMFKNSSIANLINFEIKDTNIELKTRVLQFANLGFDVASQEILSTLLAGGELYLIKEEMRTDVPKMLDFIDEKQIKTVFFPTAYFKLLQSETKYIESIIKYVNHIVVAGEQLTLTDELKELIRSNKINIHNHYGPSESHVVTTSTITSTNNIKSIPTIGRPISNNKIYILDNSMNLAPINVKGEMYIAGAGVARGYLNNDKLTKEKFIDNPYKPEEVMYKTGDLARWLPDGNIEYLGRVDEQVKIRGFRIELGEIANVLMKISYIKDVAIITRQDINGEKLIHGYVVSDENVDFKEVRKELRKELPDYMVPSYMMKIVEIPLNRNGKVDKRALPDIIEEEKEEYIAPRNEIENIVIEIFQDVIGRSKISVDSDFFEVGGHSLRATKVVNRIEVETGIRIPIKVIFSERTAESIARYIEKYENKNCEFIPKAEEKKYYPMSSAQRRMYLIWQMDKESLAYNMPACYRLEGEVREDSIKAAFQRMIDRHEILRTSFIIKDGELVQKILEKVNAEYSYDNNISEVSEILQDFTKPFALDEGNLIRMKVVKSVEEYYLLLDMHHIVSDGMSMGIFIDEFSTLYNGGELKSLSLQYKDYSEWMGRRNLDSQKEYWINKFADKAPALELPYDYSRPTEKNYEGSIENMDLQQEIKNGIKELCRITGATEYMIFLSAFMVVLNKYTHQEDIVVGTPISGRNNKDTESMMGVFINTLAMRGEPESKKSFIDFIDEVKESSLRAYENQEYPFEDLVETIEVRRDLSRNPLFDVMFGLQNNEDFNLVMGNVSANPIWGEYRISKFDLSVNIGNKEDGYFVCAEYCTALFKSETINRLLVHFKEVLCKVISNPKILIGEIKMITKEEEDIILKNFNDTYVEYNEEKTLVDIFEEQVKRTPKNIAVVYEEEQLTYEELNEKANILARTLRSNGVGSDNVVAIMIDRSIEMIVGIIGVLKSGAAYLPIDPSHPNNRIEYMLKNSNTNILLSIPSLFSRINFDGIVLDISKEEINDKEISNLNNINKSSDLAYIIYTSGTTGIPKGVMVEHKSVVNLVSSLKEFIYNKYEGNLKVALVANYAFDASVQQIFPCLTLGNTLYIVDDNARMNGDDLVRFYLENQIEITDGTPIHLSMMCNSRLLESSKIKLKHMIIGGDKLLKDTLKNIYSKLKSNKINITNVYGPTECCVDTTYQNIDSKNIDIFRDIPIGKPLNNYNVYILNKQGQVVPIGISGELYVSGDGLARGYLNNKELTNEKFIDNPYKLGQKMYKTGDLAKWLSDGSIEYLGRIDDQVKIRGFRIELGEIVNQLRRISYIEDAAVITREDSNGEKAIYAYVVSKSDLDLLEVRKEIRKELPDYMVPSYMMKIDSIPMTRNGKLDKGALPDIVEENIEEYIAPRNEIEKIIVKTFQDVLGRNKVSVYADFFEVGGHSLRATKIVNRIEAEIGMRIPIKVIFSHRTPEAIARYIEETEKTEYEFIPKAEKKKFYELSSAQRRMYLIWQMDKESTVYNMAACYKLDGEVKENEIKNSLEKIISRHEILRTCFITNEGHFVQKVLDKVDIDYSYEECREEISKVIKDFTKPFDLEKGNLIRMKVVKSKEEYYLLIDMHHIVSDGMSSGIFIKEFSIIYNGGELDAPTLQYKDYSEWMRIRNLENQKEYWISQFEDEVPIIDLPYDYKRPVEKSFKGSMASIVIGEEVKNGIKELCRTTGTTEYMLLLASFMVVLNKYTRQEDIVVGTPVSGRTNKDMESMMGVFINTLAMRGRPEDKKSFINFLEEVKESCLKAYENQEYPFEELVDVVEVRRNFSRNPLFDVTFGVQNNEKFELKLNDSQIEEVWGEHIISKFDLSVIIEGNQGEYFVNAEYSTELFKEETIKGLLAHFKEVLCKIIATPEMLIGEIQAITKEEEDLILNKFNDTYVEYDKEKTVVDLFEEQVSGLSNKVAVVYEKEKLTYEELNEKSNILGLKLRELGIKPNDFVAIVAERSLEMVIGILAIIKAGAAYVPIDPKYPEERINYILSDCKAKVLLTYKAEVKFEEVLQINLADNKTFEGEGKNIEKVNTPEDLLYLIYTSGTTGKPKGVMVKHSNIINYSSNNDKSTMSGVFKWNLNNMGSVTNMCFDIFATEIIFVFVNGMTTFIANSDEQVDINYLSSFIERNKVEILQTTPSRVRILLSQPEKLKELRSLRYIIVGGEVVERDLVDKVHEYTDAVVVNGYGPSETTISSTANEISRETIENNISIGKPIANTQVYILQRLNLCGINVPGELCIAGDGVTKGYLNKPELTAEKFIDNPYGEGKLYRTGDLARWLSDGNIEYLGRIDEQVKIRGFRIELEEIANVLHKIEYVNNVAIITKEDGSGEKAIYAYIVSDINIDLKEIKKEIRKELPDYMVPAYIMQIEEIPVTRNGKVDKKALPEIEEKNKDEYIAPESELEKRVVRVFEDVIGRSNISADADFFEIGGHSLRATKVANRIEAETGVRITIKTIFNERTAIAIARYIEKSEIKEYHSIEKAKEKKYYQMSSAQKRMYLIWQMDKEGLVYNMPTCYKLEGNVKPNNIKNALEKMIERHEILRTSFVIDDGEFVQKILYNLEADYSYEENINELSEILNTFIKPFALDEGNLVRMKVVKNMGDYYLLIDMHHIVSDGMSIGIFLKEFSTIYNGGELEELSLQYKDYSEWMKDRSIENQKEYWVSQFEDEVPVIDLPYDYKRPVEQSYEGAITSINLYQEIKDGIKELCKTTGTTEYMLLLASFMIVLNKYTRQEDIVVGTPVSGRTNKDMESMMGVFINTLAMRGRPEEKKSFINFLEEVKESCLKAYENQEYPFEELVDVVEVRRDFSRNPLFDVTFGVQNNEEFDISMDEIKISQVSGEHRISKFDLSVVIEDSEDSYFLCAEYCTALFKEETIKGLLAHFKEVLCKIIATPEMLIGEIQAITKEEEDLILNKFNDTYVEYDKEKTVVDLFEEQVSGLSNKVAVVYEKEKLTYEELNEKSNILGLKLRELGIKPNDFVAIVAERSLEMIIGILAIIKAGAAYVPIDPKYPEERINYILSDCKAKVLLTYKAEVKFEEVLQINLADNKTFEGEGKNIEKVNTSEDLLYLIYTSGTTGKPKGVMVKHSNIINYCSNNDKSTMSGVLRSKLNNMGSVTNMCFDIFATEIIFVFVNGMTTFIANSDEQVDINYLSSFIERNKVEILQTTPSRVRILLSQPEKLKELRSLRYIIVGGEVVERDLVDKVHEYTDAVVVNGYGPSETTISSTANEISRETIENNISIGKPIA
ncbi:amino acid adenylation domain-containing protein, partial [Clostridium paraputrificum]|uniref:non-ribosomal peptide synthetase n=1 Tax=Clostridium paraputrificum TaxID=29363 RepID=UPI003D33E667